MSWISRSGNSRNGSALRERKLLSISRWGTGIACRKVLGERRGNVLVSGAAESELTRFSDGSRQYRGTCCRQNFG
jgi:hypothetical protein